MIMSERKFYVVWKGRTPGVYGSWAECEAQVKGFSGAQFKGFPTQAAAEQAFAGAYQDYAGKDRKPAPPRRSSGVPGPIPDSYSVDASCIGSPGPVEYRCVHTTTRKKLFSMGPLPGGSCNIGEFLALVHALALLGKKGISAPVYSDSTNAILWLAAKKCRTHVKQTDANAKLFELIARAERWLETASFENHVLKWDTRNWGEIPADYGRK